MERLRGIFTAVIAHRAFVPVLIAVVALILGTLLAFEHSRNLVRVRGPYLAVLLAILIFPIFAFRFFDPHEDARPITVYFIAAGLYFILLGAPNLVSALDTMLRGHFNSGSMKQLGFGVAALAAIAGTIQYAGKFLTDESSQKPRGVLSVSFVKFFIYAFVQVIYLNALVMFVREKFGITTVFS